MSDIVERLLTTPTARTWDSVGRAYDYPEQLPKEAAAEIQRLRAEVAALTAEAYSLTSLLATARRERAEAMERAAQIAKNRAKGNERLALSHPEGSDGRRLAVERCKEDDQVAFAIEAAAISIRAEASKKGGEG